MPVLGMGAGKINAAAKSLRPDYRAGYRGWGWYWSGVGLDFFGVDYFIGRNFRA